MGHWMAGWQLGLEGGGREEGDERWEDERLNRVGVESRFVRKQSYRREEMSTKPSSRLP
jgi:hypothetical protein